MSDACLAGLRLDVSSLERSVAFYRDVLGMVEHGRAGRTCRVGFGEPSADLVLREAPRKRTPGPHDTYWKIGITLPDVDLASARLRDRGVETSDPAQFRDVGYLAHLTDPDGFPIELLQHRFRQNHVPVAPDDAYPLGGRPHLGQITIRIPAPDAALAFFGEELGMRLLSRQVLQHDGFTLYFLAFTDEEPPNPDIDAVSNREWLWQRSYTTLELQHRHDDSVPLDSTEAGFRGIEIVGGTGARPRRWLIRPSAAGSTWKRVRARDG